MNLPRCSFEGNIIFVGRPSVGWRGGFKLTTYYTPLNLTNEYVARIPIHTILLKEKKYF